MGFLANGLVAGAVGTELLNVATYLDMAIRARGASSLPQEDVQKLADWAGISLGAEETAENRKSALGALLGYATGGGIGVAYALARPAARRLPALWWSGWRRWPRRMRAAPRWERPIRAPGQRRTGWPI